MRLLVLTVLALAPVTLRNPGFREWSDGLPVGWSVSTGATTAGAGTSRLEPVEGGGVALTGDAGTGTWRYLSQPFPARTSAYYRLVVVARARGIRQEGRQYDNCYAGLAFHDASGRVLVRRSVDVVSPEWTTDSLLVRAPQGTAEGQVAIFLSKSGTLQVRSVRLEEPAPGDSFRVLTEEMDRYYSFFELKEVDWPALVSKYRERAEAAADPEEFAIVIREMLAELRDPHVWVVPPGRKLEPTFVETPPANFDYRAVAGKLASVRQIGGVALAGKTREGYAYLAVGSLAGADAVYAEIERAIDGMLDAPGFLLDLRGNQGGNEVRAQRIASFFADETRVYGRSKIRAGADHDEFRDGAVRTISPRDGGTFTKPVVCLIGPRCISSGEGFAMMMRVLPHVTLLGQPTRGASGNPAPVDLPNGVRVFYSRWVSLLPDGSVFEGKGIEPDVVVPHESAGDPTFDAAVAELGRRIQERR